MPDYDVAVIGGGPGGYVAAIRAAQLGKKVVLFERERVGGLCLNWGCIPSKALLRNAEVVNLVRDAKRWGIETGETTFSLKSAVERSRQVVEQIVGGVEGLLSSAGVTVVAGSASFKNANTVTCGGADYTVANVIVATGAHPRLLPSVAVDGAVVLTSREALALGTTPKRAAIIGGGPIGVEFAHLWASYGAEVTIVEMLDSLVPLEDVDSARLLRRSFEARGISVLTGTAVKAVELRDGAAALTLETKDGPSTLEADVVLIAIGFVPHTDDLNLVAAGVETDRGFIRIDDQMQTTATGVYAIGDVTGKLMLAHVAMQQGVIAAERLAGHPAETLDYIQMPRATFCQPEVGSIGYTEKAAKAAGMNVKAARFPLTALGKAVAVGDTEGFIKVVADTETGQIVGVHMIGHGVNDLLGEASMLSLLEATTGELGLAVHAHPSASLPTWR
jgi:dihydrolipoamide dehydrogenase